MISAALLGAAFLGGCNNEGSFQPYAMKAQAPIPPKLLADIADKNMDVSSPILVRVFKSESELEVWKQDRTGRYALLKTYPICKWSGDLGPKSGRRPSGAGRLLRHHARPDESEFAILSGLQHGLSQRL